MKNQKKTPILVTKFYKPELKHNYIYRDTIISRLEENFDRPLTLVAAATGYGKSVTISEWLDVNKSKYCWISLDDELNDLRTFFLYLIHGIRSVFPEALSHLNDLLHGPVVPPQKVLIKFIINGLAEINQEIIIVLDDYHVIREEQIHEVLIGILQNMPKKLRLVILTQIDPPLKLARLRAKFLLNELRMIDLAFSTEEAFKLRSLIAKDASDDQVESLLQRSEGWVTGLIVGLLGLAQGIKFENMMQVLLSKNSIIAELFQEAVLQGLPIETQKYLQLTSLVDRFCEDLISCMIASIDNKVLNEISIEKLLINSQMRNLFLIPLDSAGEWFRYHQLFHTQIKKLAEKQFSEVEISSLYIAASSWFEKKNFLEEALKYALRSEDMAYAVGVFARHRCELHNTEQIQRLDKLIKQFPSEIKNDHLELLLSLAMLHDYDSNYTEMKKYLSLVEEIFKKIDSPNPNEIKLLGEFHAVHVILSFMFGDLEQSILHAEKAMKLLPADKPHYFREFAVGWYSFTQQTNGNTDKGLDRLDTEFQTSAYSSQYFQRRLLQGRSMVHLMESSIDSMKKDGESLVLLCSPSTFPAAWMIGIYSVSCASYVNNDLEKVSALNDELWSHRYLGLPFWVFQHLFLECLSAMAREKWQKVDEYIKQYEEIADELSIEPLKGMVQAFKVESFIRQNEIDSAVKAAALANFEPYPPLFFYYIPQLTKVKLLFKTQQKEKGEELLQELIEMGKARNNKNLLIQALELKAIVNANEVDQELAKKILNEALLLTKKSKNIRTFLDLGDPMYHLLREIAQDQPENKHVMDLLQAFEDNNKTVLKSESKLTGTMKKHFDSLSNRELEILNLVNQGLKNDAIADQLFISTDTVKKHLYRAYQKLGVNNRTGAIVKLKSLGLVISH